MKTPLTGQIVKLSMPLKLQKNLNHRQEEQSIVSNTFPTDTTSSLNEAKFDTSKMCKFKHIMLSLVGMKPDTATVCRSKA